MTPHDALALTLVAHWAFWGAAATATTTLALSLVASVLDIVREAARRPR